MGLIVTYLVLAVLYGLEGHGAKTLYWIGAAIISASILVM